MADSDNDSEKDSDGAPEGAGADQPADQRVKEMLDAATRAELERWFGMPSFEQLADRGVKPEPSTEDPEMAKVRQRRADAIAAVDPALVEAHRRRTEPRADLIKFKPLIDVRVNQNMSMLDLSMIERQHTVAEPRERELPEELRDDLNDCTPQALLRDLHRPETDFEKTFEILDTTGVQGVDIVATIAEAIRTRWTLPPFGKSPLQEARELIHALREDRHRPWTDIKMVNRQVTE